MADIPRKPIRASERAALFDRDLPAVVEWESFYAEGKRTPPFLKNVPDENLVGYVEQGRLKSGNAIDLGCGIGRNAIYLARAGYRVDAIDLSRTAIGRDRRAAADEGISRKRRCTGYARSLDNPDEANQSLVTSTVIGIYNSV